MPGLYIKLNIEYLKTPQAILKTVQIITLMIAFSCITNCCDGGAPYAPDAKYTGIRLVPYWGYIQKEWNAYKTVTASDLIYYNRNAAFFQAVTILGWLVVVFLFVLFFLSLHERFNQINWEIVSLVISSLWSVLLLLCCSLMGDISRTAYTVRLTMNDLGINGFNRYTDTMVAGVVFGFFALIAFIVEAAFLCWQFWSIRKAGNSSPSDNPAARTVFVAPGASGLTTQDQTQPAILSAHRCEAPPEYEAGPNLPGQMAQYGYSQRVPYSTGQMVPNTTGQIVSNTAGQTAEQQGMVMYPLRQQQYQTAPGQPLWE